MIQIYHKIESSLKTYLYVLSIVPALFLYLFSSELNFITQSSLIVKKLCVHEFNETVCQQRLSDEMELIVQEEANKWSLWANVTFLVPAITSILYLGFFADRKSNYRLIMSISLVGYIIQSLICAIASNRSTYTCLWLILLSQFLNGVFGGGSLAFISSCFSYITVLDEIENNDTTQLISNSESKRKNRSIKFSILEASILLGRLSGSLSSGPILSDRSNFDYYQNAFVISLTLFCVIVAYVYLIFYFNDKRQIITFDSSQNYTKRLISIEFLKENLKILFKKRPHNVRFYFLSFLMIYFSVSTLSLGLGSIEYLYLIKKPISFKQTEYGLLRALDTSFKALALLVILPILKNRYMVPDYLLYLLGILSDIINLIIYAVTSIYANLIWIAPFANMFSNYYVVGLRSFITKMIDQHEIGKFFGIISVMEFLAMLIGTSVSNRIYNLTIRVLPSAVFITSTAFGLLICFPTLLIISYFFKKNSKMYEQLEREASDQETTSETLDTSNVN